METITQTKRLGATLLLMLTCMLPSLAVDYGITIGGIKVTSDNASNISGSASNITGTVKYDNSTCTLTLQNATIDCKNANALRITGSFAKEVKVNLVGTNTFSNVNGVGFYLNISSSSSSKIVTFQGTGSVEVPASIAVDGSASIVNIKESCAVKATYCYSKVGGYLYVSDSATLHLYQGSSYAGSLYGFSQFYMTGGATMLIPEGASYNTTNKYLVDANGNRVNGEVKIGPVVYNLTVGGVKVTSANRNSITGSTISGRVIFNPTINTLYLYDASIETSGYGIHNEIDGLKIYFSGSCDVSGMFPIDLEANTTMYGSGNTTSKVTLAATSSPIWVGKNVNLAIENIRLETHGATSSGAIRGYGSNSTLTLSNANIAIDAGEYPCVKNITDCTMEGLDVALPSGVCYRKNLNGFGTKTALATGTLKIMKPTEYYPVSLCGHQLNDVNVNNFCYDNVEGSVTFRETTQMISQGVYSVRQVLFLNNVTGHCDDPNDYCIKATDNAPLTINCQGTNTLTSSYHAGLFTYSSSAEVWGGGTLDLNGYILLNSSTGKCDFLVGDGSTLNASFISGAGNGTFTVNNSQVNLSGNNENDDTAISGFENVSLYKVDFVEPNEGTYSRYVRDGNGNKWKGAVKIGEKSFGITVGGVDVTTKNMDNITGSNFGGKASFGQVGDMNTLVLEDITIINRLGYGIGNKSGKPLRIMVSGTCSLSGTHAIYSEDNITIQGDILDNASLILNGNYSGICMNDKDTLSIAYLNITASGASTYGCFRGGGHSKLIMLYSNIDIDAGSYPPVKGFDTCIYGLMEITYPGETWFNSRLTGFGNDKGLITGDLIMKRVSQDFCIEVAGHDLNNLNFDNFYYENVSGILEYSPDLSVLTLAEFTANCEGISRGIDIMSDKDLTIYFDADNKFYNTYNNIGISADMGGHGLYLLGYGSLEFDGGVDIQGDLIISQEEGEELTVKAKYLHGTPDDVFRVNNSHVYLEGDGVNSTIRGFRSIEGENFAFARPINATYSDGQLWSNGQVYTGRVVISYVEHDTAIDDAAQVHDVKVDSTYDLLGRRTDSRRGGIILQHMSDGTVRKQLVK